MTDTNPYEAPATEEFPMLGGKTRRRKKVKGLGGLLRLVALGVVLSPFRMTWAVFWLIVPLFTDGTWQQVTSPESEHYHVFWGPVLIIELVVNSGFLVASLFLAYLFFRASRFFPKAYIAMLVLSLGYIVVDVMMYAVVLPDEPMFDKDTVKSLLFWVVSVGVFVPYMLKSRRVKNTFVK